MVAGELDAVPTEDHPTRRVREPMLHVKHPVRSERVE
jgi:hypothetical protein